MPLRGELYNWIAFGKQYVPRKNHPTRRKVNDAQIARNVEPPRMSPSGKTMTNGKMDLKIAALFNQRPSRRNRIARFTMFHPPDWKPNLFRLLATKEWQLQVKRL